MKKRFLGSRLKKARGQENKNRRMVKVSDITEAGFRLRTFDRDYYISRTEFPWFKGASNQEIQNVILVPCDDGNWDGEDHGDHLRWEALDVDLGINDIERLTRRGT